MSGPTHVCDCCGERTTHGPSSYDICPVCGWQEDSITVDDPTFAGGANDLSLDDARSYWRVTGEKIPRRHSPHFEKVTAIISAQRGSRA